MKRLALFLTLATLGTNAGASEYYVEFDISGSFTVNNYLSLRLEIDGEGQFMGAHGVLVNAAGLSAPATGTCFQTAAGGAFCNVQGDQTSYNIELAKNLSGTIFSKGGNGFIQDSAPITLADMYVSAP